jgi:hypothetical protein
MPMEIYADVPIKKPSIYYRDFPAMYSRSAPLKALKLGKFHDILNIPTT